MSNWRDPVDGRDFGLEEAGKTTAHIPVWTPDSKKEQVQPQERTFFEKHGTKIIIATGLGAGACVVLTTATAIAYMVLK